MKTDNKSKIKTIKEWNSKYFLIFLDKEMYPDDKYKSTFMVVTEKELNKISKRTYKRIKEFNKIMPKDELGYNTADWEGRNK